MTLVGPVVLDIVQHFTERWNEIKKRKVCLRLILRSVASEKQYSTEMIRRPIEKSLLFLLLIFYSRYDWLALPHNVIASPNEAVARGFSSF
jgi:phospholipase D1/2